MSDVIAEIRSGSVRSAPTATAASCTCASDSRRSSASRTSHRTAARDLALFVRSRRMQQIRKLNGAAFEREFHRAYPRVGRIGYTLTERGVIFTETSSTGRRFEVVVRDGRIVRQNPKPYPVVFSTRPACR